VFSLNISNFKVRLLLSSFVLFIFASVALPSAARADYKYSSLVIDANTGVILHEENAGEYRYPASLVKMMTLYMTFQAIENGKLSMGQRLTATQHACSQAPSSLGLRPGQGITLNDAVLGVIIKSANDAAVVLSEAVGGNEKDFARMMNATAKKLGMDHTNFENASGLPNPKQKTTAYDLARLAVALRRDYPNYYPLFDRDSFNFNNKAYYSHNRVTRNYRGADGLKTGYIRASGFNLVTSAQRNGKSLVGVVMGGQTIKGRDRNMMKLLDNAFYKSSKSTKVASAEILSTHGVPVTSTKRPQKNAGSIPVPELKPGSQSNDKSVASAPKPYEGDDAGKADDEYSVESNKNDTSNPSDQEIEQGGEN
jgi:D-alanyl-D-alanine carboxypeptidase